MPLDPARVQDTRAWLRRASYDLEAAGIDMAAERPLLGDAVFHCQPAAEKALKALLTWYDAPFRRTHDLLEIGAACVEIDATLEDVVRPAGVLTRYAWVFRYPGEPEEPSRAETEEAIALARAVYDAVLQRLPPEARP